MTEWPEVIHLASFWRGVITNPKSPISGFYIKRTEICIMNMHVLKAHKQIIQPNKNTLSCHWGFKTKTTKEYFHKKRLKNNHHFHHHFGHFYRVFSNPFLISAPSTPPGAPRSPRNAQTHFANTSGGLGFVTIWDLPPLPPVVGCENTPKRATNEMNLRNLW